MSARDLHQLLSRCIEAPDIAFAIVHDLSENRFKRLDLTSTRDLLGYAPQDDAFTIFRESLDEWLQGRVNAAPSAPDEFDQESRRDLS
jgi:hypothetical protein